MLGQDPLRDSQGPRLSLPFLPTLVTAVLIGAGSLLCRGPAAPPPEARVDAQAFAPAASLPGPAPRAPAALVFAEHFPLSTAAAGMAWEPPVQARPSPAPRVAAAPARRPVAAQLPPRRPEAVVARAAEPELTSVAISQPWLVPPAAIPDGEAEEEGLPALALPFAPAAQKAAETVGEAVGYVRGRAAALGGSVSILVDRLR
ncbi:hypothetical protein [Methylobacterium radiodurans]|uniref:Uncharacterized protein n=1 Tax=Methylobacterium radiodurans TaxID=2202828 RepID=A0A2U8VTI1_9HYPH|nr:hypothetical protein [Methylobacterium radiodurans]AWN37025.1 hypothetical protein DK427_15860 [Methylobacterium radiodurans]